MLVQSRLNRIASGLGYARLELLPSHPSALPHSENESLAPLLIVTQFVAFLDRRTSRFDPSEVLKRRAMIHVASGPYVARCARAEPPPSLGAPIGLVVSAFLALQSEIRNLILLDPGSPKQIDRKVVHVEFELLIDFRYFLTLQFAIEPCTFLKCQPIGRHMTDAAIDYLTQVFFPLHERLTGRSENQIKRNSRHVRCGQLDGSQQLLRGMVAFERLELAILKRLTADADSIDPKSTPQGQVR